MATTDVGHQGTHTLYAKGCRCDPCRDAERTYQRGWRERRLDATPPRACGRCGETRPARDFYKPRGDNEAFCRICTTHAGTPRMSAADGHRMRTYGLSPEQFKRLLDEQGGVCAVCGSGFDESTRLTKCVVDHDHETDEVRGLLCWACNIGLGSFLDDPARLRAAADYLEG